MSRRGRRIAAIVGVLGALLFAGRWTATLLADRWWAAELSPTAASFITDWHLLRFTLDLGGCLIAAAWFIGHLLLVYRAVGTVQVRRNVANLEFREALTPRALLTVVVVAGAVLGLLVGVGASRWWPDVALAWQGVTYGVNDPLLGHDLGLYVAQLPVWRAAHGFFVLLVLLALTGVAVLYMLMGAIRWMERRPAINHHARAHLGWLLAALALALAWGYLLERYELVAGPAELLNRARWRGTALASPVLAGVALAAGALSAVWAARPRHALLVSAWLVLGAASLVGHWLLPSVLAGSNAPVLDAAAQEQLSRIGYGLEALRDSRLQKTGTPAPPPVPSLWSPAALAQSFAGDSGHILSINPAVLTPDSRRRPVWLILRSGKGGRTIAAAVADHRVSSTGEPLFFRLGDTLPRPMPASLLDLGADVLGPDARDYRLQQGDEGWGTPVGALPRRLALAWALQAGELLGDVPENSRIDWRLSPTDRVERLAPFADWTAPTARIIDGELVWLVDGYLTTGTFPLTPRARWRNRRVGSVIAAFLATVEAESGAVRIFLQPRSDPLAVSWSRISRGMVEPATAIPEAVLRTASYPSDWFRVQAHQLERAPWKAGAVSTGGASSSAELPPAQVAWAPDTSGPLLVSAFEVPSQRRLSAILVGWRQEGRTELSLVRLDSTATLPSRDVLQDRWADFPLYDALGDSIRQDGGKLERGPLRVEVTSSGPVAYQGNFALRPSGGTVLTWVSVAAPNRLGAGRTLREAWSNLLGATVPDPPGAAQSGRLDEARRWVQHADSALRIGDWSEFGRAWNSLRTLLDLPPDTARF